MSDWISPATAPAQIEAVLNYLHPTDQRPLIYADPPPPGAPAQSLLQPTQVTIRNARLLPHPPTLDRQGFQLLAHLSHVTDFHNPAHVRHHYYPETEALIQRVTGAERALVFDAVCRLDQSSPFDTVQAPLRRVHNDHTPLSAPRRVRAHLPAAEAEYRLQRRYAIINLWRPIAHPVFSAPLAICDARSLAPQDLIPNDLVYHNQVGETYSVLANPRHRWFYFPYMSPEEALLFKIYDSHPGHTARLGAHTAFDDPSAPTGNPPRLSIELRALVFF